MVLQEQNMILRIFMPGQKYIFRVRDGLGLIQPPDYLPVKDIFPCAAHQIHVSAAPVTGMTDVCEVTFDFKNEVFRIHEDPRVTKPYSEEQWATILALGNKVDEDLLAGDVRLTMGGEPTFVSVDDMEAKEWNTAADGPQKRALGSQLIKRLKNSFGPGGLIHTGQGKWYPGEPLPRWQYSAIWRNDNYPIWKNDALLDLGDTKSVILH